MGFNEGINITKHYCNISSLMNCDNLVMMTADLGFKNYIEYIHHLLHGNVFTTLITKSNLAPLFTQIYYSQLNQKSPVMRIEVGGGSGVGFQLYCDNQFVLTAGLGGGGGIEGIFSKSILINDRHESDYQPENLDGFGACNDGCGGGGGGGGGGMQFNLSFACSDNPYSTICQRLSQMNTQLHKNNDLETDLDFISLGGGGGCFLTQYFGDVNMACGESLDFDYLNISHRLQQEKEEEEKLFLTSVLSMFQNKLQKCSKVCLINLISSQNLSFLFIIIDKS
jgi:hypothetical protein